MSDRPSALKPLSPQLTGGNGRSISDHVLHRLIGSFQFGQLTVTLPSAQTTTLQGHGPGRAAEVSVHRWRALPRFAFSGDIGLAQSVRDGDCSSPDLKALLLWGIENCRDQTTLANGSAIANLLAGARHMTRMNTRRNSRRNIMAHYDLGNDFYALWLDKGMNYSSAMFGAGATTLEHAQARKIERICELLELRGRDKVLEIGCGWGCLAEHLTIVHDAHVTGLTLSKRQRDYARDRLRSLEKQARIELSDYRDASGRFERIVSIEMLEAVGEAYWPAYFAKLRECLAPDGVAVVQVITIDEARYESYRRRPDFIQTTIFPGGMLPTKAILQEQCERAGLVLSHAERFGADYARTLALWRERFHDAWPRIAALGFDNRFRRLWDYYLQYCEAGFEAGWVDVGLYQLRHR